MKLVRIRIQEYTGNNEMNEKVIGYVTEGLKIETRKGSMGIDTHTITITHSLGKDEIGVYSPYETPTYQTFIMPEDRKSIFHSF